jgi:hypothetical protein
MDQYQIKRFLEAFILSAAKIISEMDFGNIGQFLSLSPY